MQDSAKDASQRDLLIVDDDPTNLELLEAILRLDGYAVRRAESGEEALHAVESHNPDLVIMDVRMPGISGFEACREIKKRGDELFVPVMLLTNLHDTAHKVEGLDAGADDYLTKPPQRDELRARVRALLRIRDLHHSLIQANRKLQTTNEELMRAKQTIDQELDQVGKIQRSFLPQRFPFHPEIMFGRYYGPCAQAGGDYFDIIEIGRSLWGILMADVTGHGTPAAVVMAMTHVIMHSYSSTFRHPSTALKVANEKLNFHLAPTFYVTMFYGVLDLENMKFRYCSAGHEPMFLFRSRGQKLEPLKTEHGFPLKLMECDEYDEKEVTLETDDKLILFTDGIVELRDPDKNLFGPERLQQLILKYHHLPPQPFIDAIIQEVNAFMGEAPFKDDVTLMVIQRTSPT